MSSSTRRLLVVAAAAILALGLGQATGLVDVLSIQWSRPLVITGLGGPGADEPEDDLEAAPMVKEEFLIPLTDGETDRYLRATVVIELYDFKDRDDLKEHVGQLRDAFIVRSVNLDPGALDGPQGLQRSRELMRLAVREARPELRVRGIWFSDFILR